MASPQFGYEVMDPLKEDGSLNGRTGIPPILLSSFLPRCGRASAQTLRSLEEHLQRYEATIWYSPSHDGDFDEYLAKHNFHWSKALHQALLCATALAGNEAAVQTLLRAWRTPTMADICAPDVAKQDYDDEGAPYTYFAPPGSPNDWHIFLFSFLLLVEGRWEFGSIVSAALCSGSPSCLAAVRKTLGWPGSDFTHSTSR